MLTLPLINCIIRVFIVYFFLLEFSACMCASLAKNRYTLLALFILQNSIEAYSKYVNWDAAMVRLSYLLSFFHLLSFLILVLFLSHHI